MSRVLTPSDSRLLFIALTANGLFSFATGLLLSMGAGRFGSIIGFQDPRPLIAIGLGLVAFGLRLLWLARKKQVRRGDAIAISAADLAWVLGSVVLLITLPGLFNQVGVVFVLAAAFVVLTFFELQAWALWQTRRNMV